MLRLIFFQITRELQPEDAFPHLKGKNFGITVVKDLKAAITLCQIFVFFRPKLKSSLIVQFKFADNHGHNILELHELSRKYLSLPIYNAEIVSKRPTDAPRLIDKHFSALQRGRGCSNYTKSGLLGQNYIKSTLFQILCPRLSEKLENIENFLLLIYLLV